MGNHKVRADWCKDFSRQLTAFNKAYLAVGGKKLARNLILKGEKSAVEYCVKKEAEFFAGADIFPTADVLKEGDEKEGIYLFWKYDASKSNIYKEKYDAGNICIFTDGEDRMPFRMKNVIDVSDCRKKVFLQQVVENGGLTNVTEAELEKWLENRPGWEEYTATPNVFINNTLLYHFEWHEDLIFRERDLDWLLPEDLRTPAEQETAEQETTQQADDAAREDAEGTKGREEITVQGSGDEAATQGTDDVTPTPEVSDGTVTAPQETDRATPQAGEVTEESKGETEEPKEEMEVPEELDEKTAPQKICLSKEDTQKNAEIRAKLDEIYKKAEIYLEKKGASIHRDILKSIQREREEGVYTEDAAHCRQFLDKGGDTKSPEYKVIYEMDMDAAKLLDGVTKLMAKETCFNCGFTWEEDLTFKPEGILTVTCPKCGETQREYKDKPE